MKERVAKKLTVNDVLDNIGRKLAYTTVATTMKSLEKKGFLSHQVVGWTFLYQPLATAAAPATPQPPITPPITSLAFSPDGGSVVACSQAGLHVYDWPQLNLQKKIDTTALNIHHLAFSPSGDRLAVGGGNPAENGSVEIFSWPDGGSLGILKGHEDSVMAVAWRDASSLASVSLDRSIILWDLQTGAPPKIQRPFPPSTVGHTLSPSIPPTAVSW